MNASEAKQMINATNQVVSNTSDKICLGTKELTLSDTAQSLDFTGLAANDVHSVTIKVKSAAAVADATHLVRYTQVSGDAPTTTHGMWQGAADYFEISNNNNVENVKFIAAETGKFSILSIEYYGKQ